MRAALSVVALFVVVGVVLSAAVSVPSAYADKEDRGNGWPRTVFYQSESGDRVTITQCDTPEQCKEVNGTPSANLAGKRFCEELSGQHCHKIDSLP